MALFKKQTVCSYNKICNGYPSALCVAPTQNFGSYRALEVQVTRHTSHVTRHTLHLQPSELACVPSKIDTHAGVRVGGISDQSVTVNYCVNGISAWANTSRAALSSSCWWWWSWGGGEVELEGGEWRRAGYM